MPHDPSGDLSDVVPRLRRVFLLASVAMIGVVLMFGTLSFINQASRKWIRHSSEVVQLVKSGEALVVTKESAVLDYLARRTPAAREKVRRAQAALQANTDSISSVAEGGKSHADAIASIRMAIKQWDDGHMALLAVAPARLARAAALPAGTREPAFGTVFASYATLLNLERRSLAQRIGRANAAEGIALTFALLLLAVVAIICTGLSRRVIRQASGLITQRDHLQAQTRELGETVRQLHDLSASSAEGEREIRKTRDILNAVLQSAPVGFALFDCDLRVQRVNDALAAMSSMAPEEILGFRLAECLPERAIVLDPVVSRVIATGEPVMNLSYSFRSPIAGDGECHRVASVFPICTNGSEVEGVGIIVLDTTERRKLEERSLQSQKMEAVGRLAGGVAHDFNNILTAIKSYSQLLLDDMPHGDARRDDVEEISKAANRAAGLTRQLLAFSRRQLLQPQVMDMNASVIEMENMLRRLIGEDIEFSRRLEPSLGRVLADPSQVEQVILNLVVNARDAMPDGGKLRIETANVDLHDDSSATHAMVAPGPYVMLAVSDTGCGMSRETQSRIFEPFFTTKDTGRGTGLGLSTAYGIVQQSGGNVWVYSEPGEGTTFKVYLPRRAMELTPPRPTLAIALATGGTETILLVEDETAVREVAARIFRRAGYSVIDAHNGAEALRIARDRISSIDLVVTDLVMPEMGGRQLATALRKLRPEILILFTSGYTADAIMQQSFLEPGAPFIEKPFTPDALILKVRKVLDEVSEAA